MLLISAAGQLTLTSAANSHAGDTIVEAELFGLMANWMMPPI